MGVGDEVGEVSSGQTMQGLASGGRSYTAVQWQVTAEFKQGKNVK